MLTSQSFHQTYFRPDNVVISLAGRVTPTDAVALVNQSFRVWQAPPQPTAHADAASSNASTSSDREAARDAAIHRDGGLFGSIGVWHHSGPQRLHCLEVALYLPGNGLSSRLFVELREKRGLAYEVSAFYPTRQDMSPFAVYMGTAPENTVIGLEGLRTEVEALCTTKLSEEALQVAKNKLLGQYALGKQTNAQIAQVFGWYETLGLGIEFDTQFQQQVADVTTAVAQQAARRYLLEPYISVVGPEAAISNLATPAVL